MNSTTAPAIEITVSRVVPADPQTVWNILTDVSRMSDLSPENVESRWLDDQRGVGARFRGRNRLSWLSWSTVATVTAWEPGHTFAFETSPPSTSRWTYALEAVPEGTRVTESVAKDDPQLAPIRLLQRLAGVTDRAASLRDGMTTTLERLEDAVSKAA
jgi:uncharacterized protein YndB with AHSA1/START domain